MDVKTVLHMNGGDQDNSYAKHSRFAQKLMAATKHILEAAIASLFTEAALFGPPLRLFNAADLGCAVGPNSFSLISITERVVVKRCKELRLEMPEIQIYLNDLPGNDFNSLFRNLPARASQRGKEEEEEAAEIRCFVMGTPGSFHGRLFPSSCLHFVYSNYSLHWLSKVPSGLTSKEGFPINKGKMCVSETSPPIVKQVYHDQFQEDFTHFLGSRSIEVLPMGLMVLLLHGRETDSEEFCHHWDMLAKAVSALISQGLIEQEKLDSFDVPYYTPTTEEVQLAVEKEGSFEIQHMEILKLQVDDPDSEEDIWVRGEKHSKNLRCFTEPLLSYHFGWELMDQLYETLTAFIVDHLSAKRTLTGISVVATLEKKFY